MTFCVLHAFVCVCVYICKFVSDFLCVDYGQDHTGCPQLSKV